MKIKGFRRHSALVVATVVVAVTVAACGDGSTPAAMGTTSPTGNVLTGPAGPEGIVLDTSKPLASLATAATGQPIDDIQCEASEQVAYHIHTHLSIDINGQPRAIPAGVGIVAPVNQAPNVAGGFYAASHCYYWLHVHTADDVIHIESPTNRTYTLGQFFAIWGQPLSTNQIGPYKGKVTAYLNEKLYSGSPASIPLGSREDVQIELGSPSVAPQIVDWSKSQL